MLGAIKSEFRKLLTVRSTYLIVIICLGLTVLFAGVAEGYFATINRLQNDPNMLASESTNAIMLIGFIFAFAGLLLVGHEYRYNTIVYSMTATNQRYKVLLAKIIAISAFAVVMSLIIMFFSPFCTLFGASLAGKAIGPQSFPVWSLLWRCVLCGWGYAMYAFIVISILRNQIGAIVTFMVLPFIGENILSLLLKHNTQYLPFVSLQGVVDPTSTTGHVVYAAHSPQVVLVYVVSGLAVSFLLFQKRDAN